MSEDERGWCDRDGRRVLLVEGKTDCHVVIHLAKHFDLPKSFGIFACGSHGQALDRFEASILRPDQEVGMLEDFCLDMIDADHQEVAEEAVALAEERDVANFKAVHRSKAVVHTYLAWQNEPGKPLGQSITAQALQPDQPLAERFVRWLQKLFG